MEYAQLFKELYYCIICSIIYFTLRLRRWTSVFVSPQETAGQELLYAKLRRQIWFCAFNSQNYIKATLWVNLEIYILYTNPPLISSLSFLWAFIAVLSSSVTSEQKVQ